jgi:hypothetical protein
MGNRQQPIEPQGTSMQVKLTTRRKKKTTLQDAKNYLQSGLASFERYPSVTDYERGYEAAYRGLQIDLSWLPANACARAGGPKAPQDS